MKLDSQSQEYANLCEKFRRDWASSKGPCPSIISIAMIINPVTSERFESYRYTLPCLFQGVEQHYHGTRFCCDLANSADPCENPNCGACGIVRQGFNLQKISRSSFQRFGEGFYFAPNSSKAHDYAVGNRFGAVVGEWNTSYVHLSSFMLLEENTPFNSVAHLTPHLDTIHSMRKAGENCTLMNWSSLITEPFTHVTYSFAKTKFCFCVVPYIHTMSCLCAIILQVIKKHLKCNRM